MITLKMRVLSASALALAACASGPDYKTPSTADLAAPALQSDPALEAGTAEPAAQWWRALGDETLDALIENAFAENRDLRRAVANVEAARGVLSGQRQFLRPIVDGAADYQRARLANPGGPANAETDSFAVGGGASWEIDFFGRVRRGVEAARADAQSAGFLARDAQALVAAETARAYVDFRGAEVRLRVARDNLGVQTKSLQLTQSRLEEGLGTRLDVARAAAQVKTTEAEIAPIEAARVAAANRLATLTGAPVATVEAALAREGARLPAAPSSLAIGDVASLIARRSDVRAAERALAAATARIGVARADYFPRVTFLGSVSASAANVSGVGANGSLGYGVGPTLSWAGFDIPRVRAAVRTAGARAEAALAGYEQSVLLAVEETQTALSAYGRERVRFEALDVAAQESRLAADLARDRFNEGADDFLDVLDAESRQLAAEAARAASQVALTTRYIAVYRALGAGWSES